MHPLERETTTAGRRRVLALALSTGSVLLTYVVLSRAALPIWTVLALCLALLVTMPSATELSRRVAINGCQVIGWSPLLWMVRWPFEVDHAALLIAACGGWIVLRLLRPGGGQAILPRISPADAGIGLAGAGALLTTHRLFLAGDPHTALTRLLPGYDNVAHFDMFAMILRQGSMLGLLPVSPDGSDWSYRHYPQGFHALAATLAGRGSVTPTGGLEALPAYAVACSAVVVIGTITLVAAVCSLPGLRSHPVVLLTTVSVIVWALVWGPGAQVVFSGFGNFWLCAAAAGTALVLCLCLDERPTLSQTSAVLAAGVCVALTWMPLILLLVVPVVLSLGLRLGLAPVSRRLVVRVLLVVVAGGVVMQAGLTLLRTVSPDEIVGAGGGIQFVAPMPVFVGLALLTYLSLSFGRLADRLHADLPGLVVRRARLLSLVPITAVVLLVLMTAARLRAGGYSYYLVKLMLGVELALLPLMAVLVALLVASRPRAENMHRSVRWGAAVGVVAMSALVLGGSPWGASQVWTSVPGPKGGYGPETWSTVASAILTASDRTELDPLHTEYVAPYLPGTWYHSLTGTMTDRTSLRREELLDVAVTSPSTIETAIEGLPSRDPRTTVLVDHRYVESFEQRLDDSQRARVVTWER